MRVGERIYEVRVLCPAISAEEAVNTIRDILFDTGYRSGIRVVTAARYFGEHTEDEPPPPRPHRVPCS